MERIDCNKCKKQEACCSTGTWVDLEEAKKIVSLGLKGEFYQLEKDASFPSGYRIGTSYQDNRCSFLTKKGLCAIHKVDYNLKPFYCKEFPYEGNRLSPFAKYLCSAVRSKRKKRQL